MRLVPYLVVGVSLVTASYVLLAYAVLPWMWTHYEHQKGLQSLPMVTRTLQGIPGDPLNVGLVGSKEEIVRAISKAGWSPADPVTVRTSFEIAGSVLLDRPYRNAPVSPLLYAGRRQDLAFEKEHGSSADQRHHVRLWQVLESGAEGRPVWLGSATFDRGVELSRYTGQLTHRISPDIDGERDMLIRDLVRAGTSRAMYQITGVGPTVYARNGGGDRYFTDGEIKVLVTTHRGETGSEVPEVLPAPTFVVLKDLLWRKARNAIAR
jgi:LssY C-terminus